MRRIIAVGQIAKQKNLKVAGGLMSRHYKPLEAAVEQVHGGIIGDLVTLWAYREHGPVGYKQREPGISELAHQIRNYSCFTWLNGTFLLDWLIHNLDICCWIKGAWPVSAQGQGGRQTRTEPDQFVRPLRRGIQVCRWNAAVRTRPRHCRGAGAFLAT